MAVGTRMQQRRAIASVWNASAYVLADGEIGYATDTGILKVGDGVNIWSALDPAFDSQYLPILGTAANSSLLGGISAASFVKVADTDVNPTNNTYVKRTADGGAKGTDATEATEFTTLQQLTTSLQEPIVRTVTANTTLALTDQNKMVMVNQASLTTQVTVTVPLNSTAAFPIGSWVDVGSNGAGGAKIIPVNGTVVLRSKVNVMPGYGLIRLLKINTDTWMGIELNKQGRLPKIRAVKTVGTSFGAASTFYPLPWETLDTVEVYNPDNEWFSIPGSGLPTARRIIVNKDGEYLITVNWIPPNITASTLGIMKMVNDNTMTGATFLANGACGSTGNVSVRVRLAAAETVGAFWYAGGTGTNPVDGSSGYRSDFSITRLGD